MRSSLYYKAGLIVLALLSTGFSPFQSAAAQAPKITASRAEFQAPVSALEAIRFGEIPSELVWFKSVAEAQREARRSSKPMLVRIGSSSSIYCRQLSKTMEEPAVAKALEQWVLADLTLENSADEIAPLGVGPIPALRAMNGVGRTVAAHEGAASATDLIAWLNMAHEATQTFARVGEMVTGLEEITTGNVRQFVAMLGERDATAREAAIRRLQNYPAMAALPVVQVFKESSLNAQLAALDLLETWKAPVADIDPWQPQTRTRERMETLIEWAGKRSLEGDDGKGPQQFTGDIAGLRQLLKRYETVPEDEAHVIRERLARFGRLILPIVYDELRQTEDRDLRARLTHLRYRLVAPETLAFRWPGGLERLSDPDTTLREEALTELSKRATVVDSPLLLEVFSDPAASVRELALRTLRSLDSPEILSDLLHLLDDPDPAVQISVLEQLVEKPSPAVITRLNDYLEEQTDPDRIAMAVRVLGESESPQAIEILARMLKSDEWPIRAAAVEALTSAPLASRDDEHRHEIFRLLLPMLQDPEGYVVGRAVRAFSAEFYPDAVQPMLNAMHRHPELARQVLTGMMYESRMRELLLPRLRELCRDPESVIRDASLNVLCEFDPEHCAAEVRNGIEDPDEDVRKTALTMFTWLGTRLLPNTGAAASYRPRPKPEAAVLLDQLKESWGITARSESFSAHREPEDYLDRIARHQLLPAWMFEQRDYLIHRSTRSPYMPVDDGERLLALVALAMLDDDDNAIIETVRSELDGTGISSSREVEYARLFPWLRFEQRKVLFDMLTDTTLDLDYLTQLLDNLGEAPDYRNSELMWSLLKRSDLGLRLAYVVSRHLAGLYSDPSSSQRDDSIKVKPETQYTFFEREDVVPHIHAEAEKLELLVALDILYRSAPTTANKAVDRLHWESLAPSIRESVAALLLYNNSSDIANEYAVRWLAEAEDLHQTVAIRFLAGGRFMIENLPPFHKDRQWTKDSLAWDPSRIPSGLTTDLVRPLTGSANDVDVLSALYLLILLGEKEHLEPLIDRWRRDSSTDDNLTRLVYRAIVIAQSSPNLPLLESIYEKQKADQDILGIRYLYDALGFMPEEIVAGLRKKIRDDLTDKSREYLLNYSED